LQVRQSTHRRGITLGNPRMSFRTEQNYGGVAEQSSLNTLWSFQVVTASRNAVFQGKK